MLEQLVLGGTLSLESRQKLENWLKGNEVGDDLFRARVPCDWEIGDRTGASGYGSRSIAAVMWPPQREPVIATVYITETEASFDDRNAAIAEIGEAVVEAVMAQQKRYIPRISVAQHSAQRMRRKPPVPISSKTSLCTANLAAVAVVP